MIYKKEEQIAQSIEGTIIDFETIGNFSDASGCERYKNIKPVIFGILEKDIIQISYIKDEKYIPELLDLIKSKIKDLTRPLHAYNCEFEKCIIYYCLGLSLEFHELQFLEYMSKKRAVEILGIPNYEDPFKDIGKLCPEAWWKGNYEDCIKHNKACLLKERDILNTNPTIIDNLKKSLRETSKNNSPNIKRTKLS